MINLKKYLLIVISVLLIITSIYMLWQYYALSPWTRDGRVRAEISEISSEVSGKIDNLYIVDNQEVKKGDILFSIEKIDYEIKLKQAQLELNDLMVQHNFVQKQYARRSQLSKQAISTEEYEDSKAKLDSITKKIDLAKVKIEKAQLDLSRTKITSPVNGYITNFSLRVGNYINAGTPLFAIIDKDSYYVIAYLEETKMKNVAVNKPAIIKLYSNDQSLEGKVESIGRAIVDKNATTGNQLLQNVEPTYPWVRLAQRVPIKISIDNYDSHILIPGTTCTVIIEN